MWPVDTPGPLQEHNAATWDRYRSFDQYTFERLIERAGDFSVLAMIVEDDDLLRELLMENLEEDGWQAIGLATAELALRIDDVTPHVLVTDVNLGPGLNGIELAQRARVKWPHLGIVVISARPLPHATPPAWEARFLRKPFELAALLGCMHDVLDPRTSSGIPDACTWPEENAADHMPPGWKTRS
jgi:DNA-binding response OmpR family regulator